MMNTKYTLTLIACFMAGGCVGFLLKQKKIEEKYANLAEEDAREVREYYMERPVVTSSNTLISAMEKNGATDDELNFLANLIDKYQQYQEDSTPGEHYDEMVRAVGYSGIRKPQPNNNERAKQRYDLKSASARQKRDHPEAESYEEVNPLPENESIDPETPYVIDEGSFSEEFLEHDKITLIYYAEDGVLTEENESIVPAPTDLVGFDALDARNTGESHPNTVYVRNERLGIDYEILIHQDSYQRAILGIQEGESPREKQERISRQREMEGKK